VRGLAFRDPRVFDQIAKGRRTFTVRETVEMRSRCNGASSQSKCARQRFRRLAAPPPLVVSDDRSAGAAIVLSLEAIMLALRPVALGAFRPFSQVFDLTSGPIVQGWVA